MEDDNSIEALLSDAPEEDADREAPEADDDGVEDPEGADKLGDAGKKALDAMKAKLKAERQKRIAAEAALADNANEDEDTKARQQAESAALAKANARIVKAEVRAVAAGKLADPADALNFIDLEDFEVGEDGDVDARHLEDRVASRA